MENGRDRRMELHDGKAQHHLYHNLPMRQTVNNTDNMIIYKKRYKDEREHRLYMKYSINIIKCCIL